MQDDPADELEEVMRQHQRMVFSIALRMLGDAGTAEEVAQDAFLEFFDAMQRVTGEEHRRAWLCRTAVCRSIDALRRRKTAGPMLVNEAWDDERYGSEGPATVQAVSHGHAGPNGPEAREGSIGVRLEEMVLSLPAGMRAAVVLRYGEEMVPEEIAAVLEQPLATVKSDLRRGLELLRRKAEVVLKEYVR